jgi:hypothetical protein
MGGTGLEPVTPSLSIQGSRSGRATRTPLTGCCTNSERIGAPVTHDNALIQRRIGTPSVTKRCSRTGRFAGPSPQGHCQDALPDRWTIGDPTVLQNRPVCRTFAAKAPSRRSVWAPRGRAVPLPPSDAAQGGRAGSRSCRNGPPAAAGVNYAGDQAILKPPLKPSEVAD